MLQKSLEVYTLGQSSTKVVGSQEINNILTTFDLADFNPIKIIIQFYGVDVTNNREPRPYNQLIIDHTNDFQYQFRIINHLLALSVNSLLFESSKGNYQDLPFRIKLLPVSSDISFNIPPLERDTQFIVNYLTLTEKQVYPDAIGVNVLNAPFVYVASSPLEVFISHPLEISNSENNPIQVNF